MLYLIDTRQGTDFTGSFSCGSALSITNVPFGMNSYVPETVNQPAQSRREKLFAAQLLHRDLSEKNEMVYRYVYNNDYGNKQTFIG